ncbi:hypothetical protein GWL_09770 [Herbaspirillum sp. GW103]|nr:hypothetical protein GWL_09770 [Herbaspirillum sp. GW103]
MPGVEARARFGRAGLVVVEEGETFVHEAWAAMTARGGARAAAGSMIA